MSSLLRNGTLLGVIHEVFVLAWGGLNIEESNGTPQVYGTDENGEFLAPQGDPCLPSHVNTSLCTPEVSDDFEYKTNTGIDRRGVTRKKESAVHTLVAQKQSETMGLLSMEMSGGLNVVISVALFVCVAVVAGYNIFGIYDACKTFSKDDEGFVSFSHTFLWVAFIASILGALFMSFLFINPEDWMLMGGWFIHTMRFVLMGLLFAVGIFGVVIKDSCSEIQDTSGMTTGYVMSIILVSLGALGAANFIYPLVVKHTGNHALLQQQARQYAQTVAAQLPAMNRGTAVGAAPAAVGGGVTGARTMYAPPVPAVRS